MAKGNPSPPKPQAISDIGLRKYLDDTAAEHNGNDYHKFVDIINTEVNKTQIAKLMNVDRRTIARWLRIYDGDVDNG